MLPTDTVDYLKFRVDQPAHLQYRVNRYVEVPDRYQLYIPATIPWAPAGNATLADVKYGVDFSFQILLIPGAPPPAMTPARHFTPQEWRGMRWPWTTSQDQCQILDSMATEARAGGWRLSVAYLSNCFSPSLLDNPYQAYSSLTAFISSRTFKVQVHHGRGRAWKFDKMLRTDTLGWVKEQCVLQRLWTNDTELCIKHRGDLQMMPDTITLDDLLLMMRAWKTLKLYTHDSGLSDVGPPAGESDEEDATEIA